MGSTQTHLHIDGEGDARPAGEAMTHEQVARAVVKSLGRQASSVSELVGRGQVNRTFVGDDVVVRLNRDRTPDEALTEYRKEAWCHEQAARVGVRVPAVFGVGSLGGCSYIVMERILGDTMEPDDPAAWRLLGEAARAVHHIPSPEDERLRADLFTIVKGEAARDAWQEILHRNVHELQPGDRLIGLGVYDCDEQEALKRRFSALLDHPFRYGLCHGDLQPNNAMRNADGELVLIDWGCATLSAVPDEDLMGGWSGHKFEGTPNATCFRAFVAGYGEEAEAAIEVVADVLLVKAFDLVRWALDRKPDRVEQKVDWAKAVRLRAWFLDDDGRT